MTERSCDECEGRTKCQVEGDPDRKKRDIAAVCAFWPQAPQFTTRLSKEYDSDGEDLTDLKGETLWSKLTCPDCGKPLVIAALNYADGMPRPCRLKDGCKGCPHYHAPTCESGGFPYCPTLMGWNRRNFSVPVLAHKDEVSKD